MSCFMSGGKKLVLGTIDKGKYYRMREPGENRQRRVF